MSSIAPVDMPSNLEIARVFESTQGEVKSEVAREATRIAGAWVTADDTSWMTKVLGLGIGGEVAPETLDAIDDWFAARALAPRIELTAFAPEALLGRLATRGYGLVEVGTVLVRSLGDMTEVEEGPRTVRRGHAPDTVVERVAADDDDALREAMSIACSGFVADGETVTPAEVDKAVRVARVFGTESFVVRVKGNAVGAASSTVRHGVASLFGSTIESAHRRNGHHQALMIERMRAAAEQGARLAVVVSSPGGATERNALRLGFVASYTRFSLARR